MMRLRNFFLAFLFTLVFLPAAHSAPAQKAWQKALGPAMTAEGLTSAEFNDLTNYYYVDPRPDKLLAVLKALLSLDELLKDTESFAPVAHLMAVVAHNDKNFYEKVDALRKDSAGLKKGTLDGIIKDAEDPVSPNPDSPQALNCLWAEFIATGSLEPVKKVIGVLSFEGGSAVLTDAAEWSLSANARQHDAVYDLVKQEAAQSSGKKKERLDNILLSAGTGTKGQQAPRPEIEVFDRAVEDFNQRKMAEAEAGFTKAIEMAPGLAQAYYGRGIVLLGKKEFDKAIADFGKVIELQPDFPMAYFNRGLAYIRKGDNDKALADYDKAIALRPDMREAYESRGLVYVQKNDFERAISDYGKAIEIAPDNPVLYGNRGFAYYKKGENALAIADYSRSIELQPSAFIYYNRGLVYESQGDIDRAIDDLNKAVEMRPDVPSIYYSRGLIFGKKGEPDKAISDLSKVIELDPKYVDAYSDRAVAFFQKKEYDKSWEDVRKVESLGYKLEPGFLEALKKASGKEK
jgi:tetratricopeptide (TPR) repeat protein